MASTRHIIAEQVRQGRTRKKWTRARLAEEVQVTSDEIATIEMSATDTAPALLQRLIAALGLDGKALNEQLRAATLHEEAATVAPTASASPAASTSTGVSVAANVETTAPANAPARRPGRSSAQAAAQTTTRSVPVPPVPASPADEDVTAQVIALLERVSGGHFVYERGRAWLLRGENGIAAETPLLGAYAWLTETLLSEGQRLSEDERAEARRLHQRVVSPALSGPEPKRAKERR